MSEELLRKEIVEELWRRGELNWKLHREQKKIYDYYNDFEKRIMVMLCSRRFGKSYMLLLMAMEICLKEPNKIIKYIAPQQKMVRTIIRPNMNKLIIDCPPDLRPEYKTMENLYRFPNGSEIQFAATDNGSHEGIRGGEADLCIVDEAGFCDELDYVIKSVLLPTTTTTGGKIILISTPSKYPDHEFITHYVNPYDRDKLLIKKTVHDNPLISAEVLAEIIAEFPGGVDNREFRREYLCEINIDEGRAIVPEFTPEIESEIIQEWERPAFYDAYTAMDIGFKDLTVVLFAYYDFRNAKLVIEDELVMNGPKMTTNNLARAIIEKEITYWKDPIDFSIKPVTLRVSDHNPILLNDLRKLHKLNFLPTKKDDAEAALNAMRMRISQKSIIINPRCKTLIYHLKNGIWNKKRSSFDRSVEGGHFDGIDALKYLVRNVQFYRNPFPENSEADNIFSAQKKPQDTELSKSIKKIVNIGSNKKYIRKI